MEIKPSICTLGVAVFGVINASGVSSNTVGETSRVAVGDFNPTKVGVEVKVAVAIVGVELGVSVGTIVAVLAGTGVGAGGKIICSKEQEDNRSEQTKRKLIFFIKQKALSNRSYIHGESAMASV